MLDGWPDGVVAWDRRADGDRRRVVVSFLSEGITLGRHGTEPAGRTDRPDDADDADDQWWVEVASDGVGEGAVFTGRLGPTQAVILSPRGGR